MDDLVRLTGEGCAEALRRRAGIALAALAAANEAAAAAEAAAHGTSGGATARPRYATLADYAADVARRTVCLTLLAGSGSRWVKSLAAAAALPPAARPAWYDASFDPELPRGLYRVRDFLGPAGLLAGAGEAGANGANGATHDGGRIAVAAYSLAAVKGLGRHVIVVRGHEEAIDSAVLAPLGIDAAQRAFFTQDAPFGKPLGHGDAAWQCRALWRGADYVVTNFGGDANSRATVLSALLVLDALSRAPGGPACDLLIPAARIASPAYPIGLDSGGLPRSFGHAKLHGAADGHAAQGGAAEAFTNVGLRVYRAPALLAEVESARAEFWIEGEGWAVPGNDPAGHEFALDNVDASLASRGRARILAISRPGELAPAKSLEDIPAFERAVEKVVAEDAGLGL
jgi:hypothetical protein